MSHSFLPGAEAGYLEAVRFHEGQRVGLGSSLISEFERAIGLAVARPGAWKFVHYKRNQAYWASAISLCRALSRPAR